MIMVTPLAAISAMARASSSFISGAKPTLGLVEEQQFGHAHQTDGDREHLPFAAAKSLRTLSPPFFQPGKKCENSFEITSFVAVGAADISAERQILPHRHARE